MSTEYADVVIVGGGHNGLTAAAYLAGAGLSVTILERLGEWGGAAVSQQTFSGVEARLSRYSYLVSLLPQKIIDDLSLPIELAKRRYSSYTPLPGHETGLLIDNRDDQSTRDSFEALGAGDDFPAWEQFYADTATLAAALFPGVTDPLITRSEAKAHLRTATGDDSLWNRFIDNPIGEDIQRSFENDLVRGVVLTDGLIGTFAPNIDPQLDANKCFLYHVIGGGTGDWDVPIGGMGAVSGALAHAARDAGGPDRICPGGRWRGKTAMSETEFDPKMLEALVCPVTQTTLSYDAEKRELVSKAAKMAFPVRNGIPIMLVDEARRLDL
jgi:phytoene dehydrogenase-like protein/uncharacterized protein YbaR (Trm112 family)